MSNNKIFYIMGRSGSGKDTIFNALLSSEKLASVNLQKVILHTTRPMREGEENEKEYFFISDEEFLKKEKENYFIETRAYDTVQGIWRYGTSDQGIDLSKNSYLIIGTPKSYDKLREKYRTSVIPIYISVESSVLYRRTVERAAKDKNTNKKELDRRFKADEKDFSEGILKGLGIKRKFRNNYDLESCVKEIEDYILCSVCSCENCVLDSDECEYGFPCLDCSGCEFFKKKCKYQIKN